jgi:osmotically-inducible protein OsmY
MKKISESKMRASMRADLRRSLRDAKAASKVSMAAVPLGAKAYAAMAKAVGEDNVSFYCAAYYGGGVHIDVYLSVESFKEDARLNAALSAAMDVLGDEAKYSSEDMPNYSRRDYRIERDDVAIKINASLKGEGSASCRRVKVGEEMKLVEKFEFRCD